MLSEQETVPWKMKPDVTPRVILHTLHAMAITRHHFSFTFSTKIVFESTLKTPVKIAAMFRGEIVSLASS